MSGQDMNLQAGVSLEDALGGDVKSIVGDRKNEIASGLKDSGMKLPMNLEFGIRAATDNEIKADPKMEKAIVFEPLRAAAFAPAR